MVGNGKNTFTAGKDIFLPFGQGRLSICVFKKDKHKKRCLTVIFAKIILFLNAILLNFALHYLSLKLHAPA